MADRYPSIYQRARKDACLTQEQAAELLSVSVETVKAWEQRQRVPRPEDVERMQAAYGTPWLGLEYTRATCGQLGVLPELRLQGLPTAVLRLINRATALADDYRRLMEIAEDVRIDEWEAPEFEQISENIQRVIAAGFEVLYAEAPPGIKKDRPAAGTAERRVQGLSTENDCKTIVPHSGRIASPSFTGEGVTRP